jgi:hypothetical protein
MFGHPLMFVLVASAAALAAAVGAVFWPEDWR